jgi:hypothetical protein
MCKYASSLAPFADLEKMLKSSCFSYLVFRLIPDVRRTHEKLTSLGALSFDARDRSRATRLSSGSKPNIHSDRLWERRGGDRPRHQVPKLDKDYFDEE